MASREPVVIPEKIYFKIGEVCDLVGVEAHVLRYWETEFGMLSPQKNKSGQRSYRRRDVEMALRIKELLYDDMYTIAGARKRLQTEQREGPKPKLVAAVESQPLPKPVFGRPDAPTLFDAGFESDRQEETEIIDGKRAVTHSFNGDQRDALKVLASHLLDLREMLKTSRIS